MTKPVLIMALSIVMLPVSVAHADPIPVMRYDITNALVSGSGAWSHVYTGSVTPAVPGVTANYAGGGGTLNDGVIGTSEDDTQLFRVPADTAITLYFGAFYHVDMISLFGGNIPTNSIPGALAGPVTVTANGTTAAINAQAFGSVRSDIGNPVNDRLLFTGSPLQNVLADRLTLRGFGSEWEGYYSLTEITVEGPGPAVPEPATLILFGTGLLGAALRRGRRRRSSGENRDL